MTSVKLKVGMYIFHQIPKFSLAENLFIFFLYFVLAPLEKQVGQKWDVL